MASAQNDFTSGKIGRHLLTFAVPILLSNLLQSLYGLADTLIVSHYVGEAGVAAIYGGSQVIAVLINIVTGLCLGGTVLTGQYFGVGNKEGLKRTVETVLGVVGLFALVVTCLFFVLARLILKAVQTPDQVMVHAALFLRIYAMSIPFLFLYNAISALLRGIGNSKAALLFVVVSTTCNLGLDLLFVAGLDWGTTGAAIATMLSIILCFLLAVFYFVRRKNLFGICRFKIRIGGDIAGRFLRIGFPSALQQSVFGLSMLIMTGFVNNYGVIAAAVLGIGTRIDHFAIQPTHAIFSAETSMIAQNLGAGETGRARQVVKVALAYQVGIAALLVLVLQALAPQIVEIFTNNPEVITTGALYLKLVSVDYVFLACLRTFNALAVGAGNTIFPLLTTIMNGFVFRVPIALFCERFLGLGLPGIFLGFGLANVGGTVAGYFYYRGGHWMKSVWKKAT